MTILSFWVPGKFQGLLLLNFQGVSQKKLRVFYSEYIVAMVPKMLELDIQKFSKSPQNIPKSTFEKQLRVVVSTMVHPLKIQEDDAILTSLVFNWMANIPTISP